MNSGYFWRGVAGRATGCLESGFLLVDVSESEVDKLDVTIAVDQDVLWFDVPVHNSCRVEIFYGREDLPEVLAGELFGAARLDVEELAERAVRTVLEHDEEVVVLVDDLISCGYFVQVRNVRVIQLAQDLDLALDPLAVLVDVDLGLVQDLDCDLDLRVDVHCSSHLPEVAFSKRLLNLVARGCLFVVFFFAVQAFQPSQ